MFISDKKSKRQKLIDIVFSIWLCFLLTTALYLLMQWFRAEIAQAKINPSVIIIKEQVIDMDKLLIDIDTELGLAHVNYDGNQLATIRKVRIHQETGETVERWEFSMLSEEKEYDEVIVDFKKKMQLILDKG